MSDCTREQRILESLAKRRRYFKSAADFLASDVTKDFAEGIISRITTTKDSAIATYDSVNPEDTLTIARCQERRKVCSEILEDFNPDICRAEIIALDSEIKKIHNTIELKKEKAEQNDGGFNSV
ncbi:unnamed protein product [marine sediment metagenome]|uniref:Uncharacterized protein n=1 Tax=marine sediment metagenome TaxID=412755 RepID=X0SHP8_9ZZZZ